MKLQHTCIFIIGTITANGHPMQHTYAGYHAGNVNKKNFKDLNYSDPLVTYIRICLCSQSNDYSHIHLMYWDLSIQDKCYKQGVAHQTEVTTVLNEVCKEFNISNANKECELFLTA